jgi:succinate dehydrogenase/fumarate reductase flavoprotein subunit
MFEHFGILRDKNRMLEGISKIEEIQNSIQFISPKDKSKEFNQELLEILELKNAILVSKAVAKSAIWREESRGVHLRSDFPETLQSFECSSVYFDEDVKRKDNEK